MHVRACMYACTPRRYNITQQTLTEEEVAMHPTIENYLQSKVWWALHEHAYAVHIWRPRRGGHCMSMHMLYTYGFQGVVGTA